MRRGAEAYRGAGGLVCRGAELFRVAEGLVSGGGESYKGAGSCREADPYEEAGLCREAESYIGSGGRSRVARSRVELSAPPPGSR